MPQDLRSLAPVRFRLEATSTKRSMVSLAPLDLRLAYFPRRRVPQGRGSASQASGSSLLVLLLAEPPV